MPMKNRLDKQMNQRIKRSSRKHQNTEFISVSTGGLGTRHSSDHKEEVKVEIAPEKATGDIKKPTKGFAKASPVARVVEPKKEPKTSEDVKKTLAKFTKPAAPKKEDGEQRDSN